MDSIAPKELQSVETDPEATIDLGYSIEGGINAPAARGVAQLATGVDYSARWTSGLVTSLQNGGYSFAVRYVGTPGRGKSLVAAEVAALRAAGISLVSVYEDREGTALLGYDRGAKDARAACADAEKLGMPKGRPVYLAVDTDTTPAKVAQYFKGAIAAIGKARVGVYGGYWIIKGLADQGLASWFWQTRAWSRVNGVFVWDARDHLRQFPLAKPFYVLGSCDLDWAMQEDYGGWWDSAPPAPPAPKRRVLRVTDEMKLPPSDPRHVRYVNDKDPGALGEIRVVQDLLYIMPRSHRDGIYGPETELAVPRFQGAHPPLVVDGIVGPKSWAQLTK